MNKADKMLYQENKLGSGFVVLYIITNMAFTIFNLKNMPVDIDLGGFIMLNILLSLVGFLASTKMKVYLIKWGNAGIVLGLFQFIRLMTIPEGYTATLDMSLKALLVASGICMLIGSIVTIRRSKIKDTYELELKEN